MSTVVERRGRGVIGLVPPDRAVIDEAVVDGLEGGLRSFAGVLVVDVGGEGEEGVRGEGVWTGEDGRVAAPVCADASTEGRAGPELVVEKGRDPRGRLAPAIVTGVEIGVGERATETGLNSERLLAARFGPVPVGSKTKEPAIVVAQAVADGVEGETRPRRVALEREL